MKNIMISSILAVTACLTMISQANAAPDVTRHHTAQMQHQKAVVKYDHKHKQVKKKQVEKKAVASQHQSKRPPTAQQVKSKYQNKNIHKKHA
ncbi:hypothetical protein [Psychrobacter vallis]|uniref:hypothetical protein n=1 Tax=Psychrobacter vallis TaxID=248451 RepID=UPI00191A0D5C|nr:hypothetical protein [Psychrobacter vallis]